VLALHGLSESKWSWIFPKPIEGIFLIVPDRMGHGGSSQHEEPQDYKKVIEEYLELIDELKVDKFYVTGHSMGGLACFQIAAAFPERVIAIAPISAPIFLTSGNPSVSKADLKKCDTTPGGMVTSLNKKTCWGSFSRCFLNSIIPFHGEDKTKDPGMAAHFTQLRSKECGGNETTWKVFDKDLFFVTKGMDSNLHGTNAKWTVMAEWKRMALAPEYDISTVKCPTFIYNGKEEATSLKCAEIYHSLVEGSELTIFPDHGHWGIALEAEKIIRALIQNKIVPASEQVGL